jgi:hypothetical protein
MKPDLGGRGLFTFTSSFLDLFMEYSRNPSLQISSLVLLFGFCFFWVWFFWGEPGLEGSWESLQKRTQDTSLRERGRKSPREIM